MGKKKIKAGYTEMSGDFGNGWETIKIDTPPLPPTSRECKKGCLEHKYHCGNCLQPLTYSPANYASRPQDIPNPCKNCNPEFYEPIKLSQPIEPKFDQLDMEDYAKEVKKSYQKQLIRKIKKMIIQPGDEFVIKRVLSLIKEGL